ncbi:hypothetical protein [Actinomadura xylanilytica]|uniref:hypothetical protein n=1 Tax=Actinomadura xylanilytica TaxID=887459 RepID=UPI00255B260C|nr:hypothetical protein [Actinomadura xylanilytica]MDL4770720.1 hypothetical protein [Actinomadura xylanilytica]
MASRRLVAAIPSVWRSARSSTSNSAAAARTANMKAGDHIGFVCGRDDAFTRVKRVARYASFEEMLDVEGAANVNPDSPREQQLANIRRIYGPEKEALDVLAVEIELLQPATA